MLVRDETGTIRAIVGIAVRDEGNVLRDVQVRRVRDAANVSRVVFSSLAVTLSPSYVSGTSYSPSSAPATTSLAYSTVTGGTPPYSYVWNPEPGWSAANPGAPNTGFISPPMLPGDFEGGVASVTVTNSGSPAQVATSTDITIFAQNTHF